MIEEITNIIYGLLLLFIIIEYHYHSTKTLFETDNEMIDRIPKI